MDHLEESVVYTQKMLAIFFFLILMLPDVSTPLANKSLKGRDCLIPV